MTCPHCHKSLDLDGMKVRALRKKRKLTLRALGELLGMSGVTMHYIETEQRNGAEYIRVLSEFFDVPIKEITK